MSESAILLLCLDGLMHGWGAVARDGRRPAGEVPGRSSIVGLLANACGWRYEDAARTNALQQTLRLAVGVDVEASEHRWVDYQTAKLSSADRGWTRRGVEGRESDFADGTHILRKEYREGAPFYAAIGLSPEAPVTVAALADAVRYPARTLFLGRRTCLPLRPCYVGVVHSVSPYVALRTVLTGRALVWCDAADAEGGELRDTDRRDFVSDRWTAAPRMRRLLIDPEVSA